MKLRVLILTITAAFILAGCAGNSRSISVFNWGDFIDMDVIAMFEEEYGIRVIYDTYASNEAMYTRLSAGGAAYDIAFPSDYMIERMINEDMLEKLDFDNIPNARYIHPRFLGLPHDPADEYSVPYKWGTLGILYNTEMVPDPGDSWAILWNEAFANRIFMYNSQRDSFAVALKKLGYSLNTTNIDELNAATEALIRQKPLVRAYGGDNIRDSMIGNEGALAVVYAGDAMWSISENPTLNYFVPIEGSNVFFDSVVIPKGARNKADAEKFINFLNRPDIAAMNTNFTGYSTTNMAAPELIDPAMAADPIYWPDDETYRRLEAFRDLGEFIREYDRAWTEVLAAR
ncbi:MAG: ABC transporter substrate-binding protein [Defluviitaleaceae bacterium]|nr:ABC transporter substrate-binding protein [Defluviitaleaceae bacterium]